MNVLGTEVDESLLSETEQFQLRQLCSKLVHQPPELEDIWQAMDDVWDELGCDNRVIEPEKLKQYYEHPVWLLNGCFIEQHDVSLRHRQAIAQWIAHQPAIRTVLDYGGGFGTLARMISQAKIDLRVDIYEPHPSQFSMARIHDLTKVRFVSNLDQRYDCVVSTDVLEHVEDPLRLFAQMVAVTQLNGYLIIANCFYPVIKCHLPSTFHLRYTFRWLIHLFGLKKLPSSQFGHIVCYQKVSDRPLNWPLIRLAERLSVAAFPALEVAAYGRRTARQFLHHAAEA